MDAHWLVQRHSLCKHPAGSKRHCQVKSARVFSKVYTIPVPYAVWRANPNTLVFCLFFFCHLFQRQIPNRQQSHLLWREWPFVSTKTKNTLQRSFQLHARKLARDAKSQSFKYRTTRETRRLYYYRYSYNPIFYRTVGHPVAERCM